MAEESAATQDAIDTAKTAFRGQYGQAVEQRKQGDVPGSLKTAQQAYDTLQESVAKTYGPVPSQRPSAPGAGPAATSGTAGSPASASSSAPRRGRGLGRFKRMG